MTEVTKTHDTTIPRKKRRTWYIHLFIFAIVQILLLIFEGASDWLIFNLNPVGEWVLATIPIAEWVPLHNNESINFLTAVWGIVVILHGIVSFSYMIWPRESKSTHS
ncbi:YfzA-like protein [Oceanobacillus limi]|uniref:YfzA-like protein n=1 Tax=Oceanobacillus limi TaxID=930131 RepID=A0A1I0EP42_9BACI|nr:YfzA family protein [Oceanobacillus limi]SET47095.1 YfzA-like protein [Oceanobacillus limi]